MSGNTALEQARANILKNKTKSRADLKQEQLERDSKLIQDSHEEKSTTIEPNKSINLPESQNTIKINKTDSDENSNHNSHLIEKHLIIKRKSKSIYLLPKEIEIVQDEADMLAEEIQKINPDNRKITFSDVISDAVKLYFETHYGE